MGCGQSNTTAGAGNNAERDSDFRMLVDKKNALADAISTHWTRFLRENEHKAKGDDVSYEKYLGNRKAFIQVNNDLKKAKKQKLDFDTCSRIGDSFLGFAMTGLGERNWGGSLRHSLRGAPLKESTLSITGSIAFLDDKGLKCTIPYNVDFGFFIA